MGIRDWVLKRLAIRGGVTVGHRFHVGQGSVLWAPRELIIGDDVYVGKHVTIEVDGEMGDGTLIANAVGVVGRTDHEIHEVGSSIRRAAWVGDDPARLSSRTVIGSDVWIGCGAVILSGVVIGGSSVVAAGALVTRDVPPNTVVVGSPARALGKRFGDREFVEHRHTLATSGVRRMTDD